MGFPICGGYQFESGKLIGGKLILRNISKLFYLFVET